MKEEYPSSYVVSKDKIKVNPNKDDSVTTTETGIEALKICKNCICERFEYCEGPFPHADCNEYTCPCPCHRDKDCYFFEECNPSCSH